MFCIVYDYVAFNTFTNDYCYARYESDWWDDHVVLKGNEMLI